MNDLLPIDTFQYQPFPACVLPEPLKSYVRKGAKALGCDPGFIAPHLLSLVAGAIGGTRWIELKKGWTEPAIIWTATVGESGSIKTPAFNLALKHTRHIQDREMRRHDEAMQLHEQEQLAYERELQTWKRSKNSADPPAQPQPPKAKRLLCSDTTVEGLAVLLQDNPRGLLLGRDELAGWVASFDRYASGRGGDVSQWLEMWSGGQLLVDRKTGDRRTIYVPNAIVSVAGTIQPAILERVLGVEHFENGLAARLLVSMPPRRVKRWTEAVVPESVDGEMSRVLDRLYSLSGDTSGEGEVLPVRVPLAPDGKKVFVDFCNRHAEEQVKLTGYLAAMSSKLEAYRARFALVFHLVRWAANAPTLQDANAIDAESVVCAEQVVRWFGGQAERVYATLNETTDQRQGRQTIEMIQARGGSITVSDFQRSSRRFRDDPNSAREELKALEYFGVGRLGPTKPGPLGGRPSEVFILHESYGGVAETIDSGLPEGVSATEAVEHGA